jgi:diguanylate cyclase (GGDEF)-like protein
MRASPACRMLGSVSALVRVVPMAWSGVWSEPDQRHFFVGRDMTEQKAAEEKLWRLAHFDQLTGLPNRTSLAADLNAMLDESAAIGSHHAIAIIGLDGFKDVNDTLGHSIGDELLRQVAERMVVADDAGRAYRLGGDQFVLLIRNCGNPIAANEIAEATLNKLSNRFEIEGHELFVAASVGVTIAPADGSDADSLLANADLALHSAKSAGGRRIRNFVRGTLIGSLCALIPGTGPTIASCVAYAAEKKVSRNPETFGTGNIKGVASPETATHSSVQGDFIPTMSLGIPGDATMALLLGALIIQGIVPGPSLISEHPDIFWGLIASFWIGNILLVILNVPMIGLWVKLLLIPYRYLYPSAIFFICIGVYSVNNDFFQVGEVVVLGVSGYILLRLGFHPAPILLGFVLGPRFEENFRRAMLLSGGDPTTFIERPISAVFVALCCILIVVQIVFFFRKRSGKPGTLESALEGKGFAHAAQLGEAE